MDIENGTLKSRHLYFMSDDIILDKGVCVILFFMYLSIYYRSRGTRGEGLTQILKIKQTFFCTGGYGREAEKTSRKSSFLYVFAAFG